jgi:hypothetical protein
MHRAVLIALTLSSLCGASVARADEITDPLDVHAPGDEPNGYVSGGIVIDASDGYWSKGPVVEAGRRIGRGQWFGRAMLQAGAMDRSDEGGRGTFLEVRAGIETRSCGHGGMVCGSAGLDVGMVRSDFDHLLISSSSMRSFVNERLDGYSAVPRLTLDAGGRIRFRVVAELPFRMRTSDAMSAPTSVRTATMTTGSAGDRQFERGAAISVAIAVGY